MKTSQVNPGLWNQGNQPGDKVQRLKYDMRRTVAPGCLQLIAHPAVAGY